MEEAPISSSRTTAISLLSRQPLAQPLPLHGCGSTDRSLPVPLQHEEKPGCGLPEKRSMMVSSPAPVDRPSLQRGHVKVAARAPGLRSLLFL